MNKFTLPAISKPSAVLSHSVVAPLTSVAKSTLARLRCWSQGQAYDPNPGPQWQQLELPFSRTPVRKWNR